MAKEKVVDELVVKIKADLRQLKRQLKSVESSLKLTGKKGQGAMVPMAAGAGAAAGAMKKLAGPAAILAVLAGTTKLICPTLSLRTFFSVTSTPQRSQTIPL